MLRILPNIFKFMAAAPHYTQPQAGEQDITIPGEDKNKKKSYGLR